jgi:hypothetical protein
MEDPTVAEPAAADPAAQDVPPPEPKPVISPAPKAKHRQKK